MGKLYRNREVTKDLVAPWFESSLTVCVGDRTVERMAELEVSPSLEIVDMKEQRGQRSAPALSKNRIVLTAVNDPGTISVESLNALNACLERIKTDDKSITRLLIEGEEDLLVLPVVAFFPERSIILYGQPNEGLVKVDVEFSRENAKYLLARMGIASLKQ